MKRGLDYALLLPSAILVAGGMLFLSTLSAPASMRNFGHPNYYSTHQLYLLLFGLFLALIAYNIPLSFLKKTSLYLFLFNVAFSLLAFLPGLGTEFHGASRWVNVGIGVFQPAEFLKLTSILFLASWLASRIPSSSSKKGWIFSTKKGYHNLKDIFLPFLVFLAVISLILFFQRDLSTLGIIGLTLIIVYFSAKTPIWHTLALIFGGIVGLSYLIISEPYRLNRLLVFLNSQANPQGEAYQITQSLIAIGSGGIFGKGWGMSSQKFGFVPQAMSDSIFAVLGEETGIIGTSIVVILFLWFLWAGLKIVRSATDKFSQLTALGITFWIAIQAFLNIAANTGLAPLAGIPLPFFSYGGSHLIAELIGIGMLLNISRNG